MLVMSKADIHKYSNPIKEYHIEIFKVINEIQMPNVTIDAKNDEVDLVLNNVGCTFNGSNIDQ